MLTQTQDLTDVPALETKLPRSLFALAAVLLLLWFMALAQLSLEWRVNALYAYGWAIPVLAAYLFSERWVCRPRPGNARWRGLGRGVIVVAVGLFLPLRVVQEANPDWILLNWLFTCAAVVATFGVLYVAGGVAWARHFAFPVLFIFTAVAWPSAVENALLQNLALAQAFLSTEVVNLLGQTAVQNGATITVNGTDVLVDEACSGIKSVQTAFMMSLFFGEFYRLLIFERVMLVVSSFAVAFCFNFLRTLTLTWVGGTTGAEGIDTWHDPLGWAVLVGCLGALWLMAWWFARYSRGQAPEGRAAPEADAGTGPAGWGRFGRVGLGLVAFCGFWLVGSEATARAWYALNEGAMGKAVPWTVRFPEGAEAFRWGEFSEAEKRILKFNRGSKATWIDANGHYFSAYYLRWEPGRVSRSLAWAHSPVICLPSVGLELEEAYAEPVQFGRGPLSLRLSAYRFSDAQGVPVFVFHCVDEDRQPEGGQAAFDPDLNWSKRLAAVAAGLRNQGQRTLGLSLRGPADFEEARAVFKARMQDLVQLEAVEPERP
jgi:exosortase